VNNEPTDELDRRRLRPETLEPLDEVRCPAYFE
jgi:hypothetical protein